MFYFSFISSRLYFTSVFVPYYKLIIEALKCQPLQIPIIRNSYQHVHQKIKYSL
jgi:hypothetical protein